MEAIPEGFSTLTPALIVNDAARAIELYKKAFDAKELYRMNNADKSKILHACLEIGNSKIFISDTDAKMECSSPSASTFYVYLDHVDTAILQAKQAGMKELFATQDMFYGDRVGSVEDSFGMRWSLATHIRDVSPEEMEEGIKKMGQAA